MVKKLLFVCALAVMLFGLAGCSNSEEINDTPKCVSFVLGINENFPKINFQSEVISDPVYDAAFSFGAVSAVVADGEPFVGNDFNIQKPAQNIDKDKKRQLANDNMAQMLMQMSKLSPKAAETDLLSAIDLSADWLHSKGEESELHMTIIASGLITEGLMNMTKYSIVDEPTESLVAQLKEVHALPDLSNIHVTWIGFGQVSGKQGQMTKNYEYKLKERMEAILTEAGAASVKFDSAPLTDGSYAENLPSCSVVPIVEDVLDVEHISSTNIPQILKWDETSRINFLPDSAEFTDTDAVREELEPVAFYMVENPKETLYVFGMTATVAGENAGKELSYKRAEAVKELLTAAGAEESQICCVGLGQIRNPLRTNDIDENGMQITEQAQKNRAVFLIKGDSEIVDTLLNCL